MPWARHRLPLTIAAVLDASGLVTLAFGLHQVRYGSLAHQKGLMLALTLIYLSLGWLFGSYTLLKLRRVTWPQVLARLGTTSAVSAACGGLLGWALRVPPEVTLLHRSNLVALFGLAFLWSGLVRLLLRRVRTSEPGPRWQIVALAEERAQLEEEWRRGTTPGPLPPITTVMPGEAFALHRGVDSVALSAGVVAEEDMQGFCQQAVSRGLTVTSLVEMAEQELQRIPPRWVGDQWLMFSGRIDGQRTSVERQLKRYADALISLVLLVASAPLLLLAALLVKAQDGGPVLYRQCRTGLLGEPFYVFKIRSMVPAAEKRGARWAERNDHRITPVGHWLRRMRIDELPQLLNVLRGEMSLIGPRPERPELEQTLEARIPNYSLRHWMRPGLSGWAQVNMNYGSSVEDSELKLSYDLFYLRNVSSWLDLLILFKTIKTVLKGAGR